MQGKIKIQRVYDLDQVKQGQKILVDRLWPRGIKKSDLEPFYWAKDLAPSKEVRQAFNHQPERFESFKDQYLKELDQNPQGKSLIKKVQDILKDQDLILLYGAKDQKHNQAIVLKDWLEKNI
ncbi:MAG: DUF488 family protein [Bacillota bacterium]|nr:DUF488 family protein [Bacillota bacterium]